jgi:hypothetical protein
MELPDSKREFNSLGRGGIALSSNIGSHHTRPNWEFEEGRHLLLI